MSRPRDGMMRRSAILGVLCACSVGERDVVPVEDTDTDVVDSADSDLETDRVETSAPTCTDEAAVVEVGTGEREFAPLSEGDDLVLVHGPQGFPGAWHLPLAVRADRVPEFVILRYTLQDADDDTWLVGPEPASLNVALVPEVQGVWNCKGSYTGIRAIVNPFALGADPEDCSPWERVTGRNVVVRLGMVDPSDQRALGTGEIRVRPVADRCDGDPFDTGCACDLPVSDQPACCATDWAP